jgi:outer membrane protein assembly factor BamA
MGGSEKMRGVYLGRYRDKLMTIVQTEIRFPIYWILSAVAFGGLGEVAPDFNGYTLNGIHWSAGAGLRLMVDSQHKANIRFDYGISKDQHFFFFGFGEAF